MLNVLMFQCSNVGFPEDPRDEIKRAMKHPSGNACRCRCCRFHCMSIPLVHEVETSQDWNIIGQQKSNP